ncbi:MAG: Type II site-specific deoxyribonuclease [Dehalococcoidia bacterium]|nr:Type II site-specific deoxyribonuclease [Dehalococcoidia bacterium]
MGYQAETPKTLTGKSKATGYPDIEFIDEFGRSNYLECKTYNIEPLAKSANNVTLSKAKGLGWPRFFTPFRMTFARGSIENISTTQRSFYLSPSEEFKITKDAHHIVVSFEAFVAGNKGGKYIFKCRSWKIISLEKLLVDVKYEFNSDNKRLYSPDLILAEGEL